MELNWQEVCDRIPRLRVGVVGDVMLDSYLCGGSHRLCPEAPVPVVDVHQRLDMPGGAGNVAMNAAALGAQVRICGLLGDDCEGTIVRNQLRLANIDTSDVLEVPGRATLFKARVICDDHLIVRFDQGTKTPPLEYDEQQLLLQLAEIWSWADVVVVSDYGYGTLAPAMIEEIGRRQRKAPKVLAVDAKQLAAYRGTHMTVCKPNFKETLNLLGLAKPPAELSRVKYLENVGDKLLSATGARLAALTLDREGALFFERNQPPYRTFAEPAPHERAAGAGDTFLAALALALAAEADTRTAAEIAATAAAVVVGRRHTSSCSLPELAERLPGGSDASDLDRLRPRLAQYRREGRRIVMTNGCFDILHSGHITYLRQAKQLGDVLIVGVNTDDSIRRLKGPTRPINGLSDRMGVLRGLSSVDHVVAMPQDTPHELIRVIQPDVFVKGGDYTRATLPEAALVEELGGVVKILPFLAERSTTSIISRICRSQSTEWEVNPYAAAVEHSS